MANHALRVNYKRRAPSDSEKAEDAIFTGDFLVCIAKQRKFQAQFLRKTAVGLRLINADSKHLCTRLLKSGKPILVCHQLPGSARRVRVNKKSQHDTILSTEIAQPNESPGFVGQLKIRRLISNVQCNAGYSCQCDGIGSARRPRTAASVGPGLSPNRILGFKQGC